MKSTKHQERKIRNNGEKWSFCRLTRRNLTIKTSRKDRRPRTAGLEVVTTAAACRVPRRGNEELWPIRIVNSLDVASLAPHVSRNKCCTPTFIRWRRETERKVREQGRRVESLMNLYGRRPRTSDIVTFKLGSQLGLIRQECGSGDVRRWGTRRSHVGVRLASDDIAHRYLQKLLTLWFENRTIFQSADGCVFMILAIEKHHTI